MTEDRKAELRRLMNEYPDQVEVSTKTDGAVFTAQPYPLFLALWDAKNPLVGRIIGWDALPGKPPIPVVVWEQDGQTWLPLRSNLVLDRQTSGPMWIRDTPGEALAAAKAHVPAATMQRR